MSKTGVNAPCPCGNKKVDGTPLKYKKCCMNNEDKKQEPVAGVLRGPIPVGPDNDLFGRFIFGLGKINQYCVPKDKYSEFSKDYNAFFQNLLEAKSAVELCGSCIKEHIKLIESGKDGIFTGSQININKIIDTELNIFFKDFFIRGAMAMDTLKMITNRWFGYKIDFLFADTEKKFNDGARKFKLKPDDERFKVLHDFLKNHRKGWYDSFKDFRDKIEHTGYVLPAIQYKLEKGAVVPVFPSQDGRRVDEIIFPLNQNIAFLCEEILAFILSLEIQGKGLYSVLRIPEEKRAENTWARYKLGLPQFPDAHVS